MGSTRRQKKMARIAKKIHGGRLSRFVYLTVRNVREASDVEPVYRTAIREEELLKGAL